MRKVDRLGKISYHGRAFRIGKAFCGQHVALRATSTDGIWDIYLAQHKIGRIAMCRKPTQREHQYDSP